MIAACFSPQQQLRQPRFRWLFLDSTEKVWLGKMPGAGPVTCRAEVKQRKTPKLGEAYTNRETLQPMGLGLCFSVTLPGDLWDFFLTCLPGFSPP